MQFYHKSGQYIEIAKAKIYAEEKGSRDKFPLVFLHGGLGNINDFGLLHEMIQGEYRCIWIDSRGHGRSTLGSEVLTYQLLQNDVEYVLDSFGISKCSVIGFSDGGILAYRLAMSNSSRFSRIITIGADWESPSGQIRTLLSSITAEKWSSKFPESVKSYKELNPEPDFDRLLKLTTSMWLDSSESGYPGQRLRDVESSTLMIRGDEDHLMPRDCIARVEQLLPTAKVLNVPFAGHLAHRDQPEIVGKIISQFLVERA